MLHYLWIWAWTWGSFLYLWGGRVPRPQWTSNFCAKGPAEPQVPRGARGAAERPRLRSRACGARSQKNLLFLVKIVTKSTFTSLFQGFKVTHFRVKMSNNSWQKRTIDMTTIIQQYALRGGITFRKVPTLLFYWPALPIFYSYISRRPHSGAFRRGIMTFHWSGKK